MFGIIAPSDRPVPKRRTHQKSRNGCTTCKEKRQKCDELKPVCSNCKRRFVTIERCNYGDKASLTPPTVSTTTTTAITARVQGGNGEERGATLKRVLSPVPSRSLAGALLDPFASYPETTIKDVDVDILMKYYLTDAVYKYYPWQPSSNTNPTTTYYVPLVWNDPVLFHAVLQLTCLRLEKVHKYIKVARQELRLRAESTKLLRLRVEENCVNDETISAVATLAAIEHEKGNMLQLRMHMSGLKQMIILRGGLQDVRVSNPMVANFVFWVFIVTVYETPFPPLDPTLPSFFPEQHNLVSSFSDLSTQPMNPPPLSPALTHLSEQIYGILISVQHISQIVPSSNSYPTAATSLVILTRLMTLLSHLMSLPPITELEERSRLMSESTRYALLLHVFTPWKGLPPDGSLAINNLLHRLISLLQPLFYLPKLEPEGLGDGNQNGGLLFWVVAVGGVAADGLPERKWFVAKLSEMCNELNIKDWEDWKEVVRRVVWHEILCAPLHKKLFNEVMELSSWEGAGQWAESGD